MKRWVPMLLAAMLVLGVLPAESYVYPPPEGVDPCVLCAFIPAWCFRCALELWWNGGDCFPGSLDCY
ncbi:MAG: hypothetical protein FJY75_12440 [Candidatus Eisenbacteria bacterium]|uniref:Uncharacterized protein n=1 Tax=Eiseniibacteriota bacterium TaxID=2212470 RepID=A0A937XAI0_UNCEI|nr:hypothetical protein [Candidatus Eisenbacteria bacterium]